MCSTFSVCSKRRSVIMMSTTSCNFLLVSFDASHSTVIFHPSGVLSHDSVYFVCELSICPDTDPLSLLCHGLHKASNLCWSRLNGHWLALGILGHKQTSTLVPHNRLANCRVRHSRRVSRDALAVLRAAVSTPNVICPDLLSALTPHGLPN